jgi:hypothetical protein
MEEREFGLKGRLGLGELGDFRIEFSPQPTIQIMARLGVGKSAPTQFHRLNKWRSIVLHPDKPRMSLCLDSRVWNIQPASRVASKHAASFWGKHIIRIGTRTSTPSRNATSGSSRIQSRSGDVPRRPAFLSRLGFPTQSFAPTDSRTEKSAENQAN